MELDGTELHLAAGIENIRNERPLTSPIKSDIPEEPKTIVTERYPFEPVLLHHPPPEQFSDTYNMFPLCYYHVLYACM